MNVFASLKEEHVLLLRLVGELERARGGKETRNHLLVLLKALEAHEALEHLVFDDESGRSAPRAALALVSRQHRALGELRAEAAILLRGAQDEHDDVLRRLTARLALLLRRHFDDEELKLWPCFNSPARRQRLDRLARAQIKTMRKELVAYRAAVEDYLD